MEGNKPKEKFRAGSVTATIWNNTQKDKDGKEYEFSTVNIERNYKDKDDNWKSTSSFRINDLPRVSLVCKKAFEYLAMAGELKEE